MPFCSYDGRWVRLWYLSAGYRYTAPHRHALGYSHPPRLPMSSEDFRRLRTGHVSCGRLNRVRVRTLFTVPIVAVTACISITKNEKSYAMNNHWWRLFGAIFIGGALRGGTQAMTMAMSDAVGAGQIATGYGSVINQALSPRLGRALDTRPTIEVDAGQICNVLLTQPLSLPAIWQ